MTHQSPDTSSNSDEYSGLEVSQKVSARLAVTARKLRFSTSSRSDLFKVVGLRPKLSERLYRAALVFTIVVFLVVPNVFSVFYYGFFAADQYQSETRFTVRTATPALGRDQLGKATGIPAAKIVQDTQIVAEFVTSKAMLDSLAGRIDLRGIYGSPEIDVISRLRSDSTAEDLLAYWRDMITVAISPSSGIVTVKVRAFTAQDAQHVLSEVVRSAELAVNDINRRIWRDVTDTAQKNLDRATDQLRIARENMQAARNESGMLSVESTAAVLASLAGNIERERLELEQKYEVQSQSVRKDAPQLRVLRREIVSKERQLKELQDQLAGQSGSAHSLVEVSNTFAQRQLEQGLAEQQFASSVKTMEQIRFVSRQQLLYLDAFLLPDKPDAPRFPKRMFWIGATLVASFLVWGAVVGGLSVLRRRLQ